MKQSVALTLSFLLALCVSPVHGEVNGAAPCECAIDGLVTQASELSLSDAEQAQMAWRCWALLAKLTLIEQALRDAAGGGDERLQSARRRHKISRGEALHAAISRALRSIDPLVRGEERGPDPLGAKRAVTGCTFPSFNVYGFLNSLRSAYTRLELIEGEIERRMQGYPEDWIPISAAEIPYTITEPGVYRLICEVDSSGDSPLITVNSPGVVFDLAGHTLEDIDVLQNQVGVDINASHVTAQNGRIRNCLVGVRTGESASDTHSIVLRGMRISGCQTAVFCRGISQACITDLTCVSNQEGIFITTDSEPSAQDVQDVIIANNQVSGSTDGRGIAVELVESSVEAGPVVIMKNVGLDNADSVFFVSQVDGTQDVLLKSNIAMGNSLADGYEVWAESAGAALVNNYASQNNVNYDLVGVVDSAIAESARYWEFWENLSVL